MRTRFSALLVKSFYNRQRAALTQLRKNKKKIKNKTKQKQTPSRMILSSSFYVPEKDIVCLLSSSREKKIKREKEKKKTK